MASSHSGFDLHKFSGFEIHATSENGFGLDELIYRTESHDMNRLMPNSSAAAESPCSLST